MVPKTGQLRIANVDENDLRHSYTCRIVNKLTGFTQESSTFGRIYFGKQIRLIVYFCFCISLFPRCKNFSSDTVFMCKGEKKNNNEKSNGS